ncbi:MAG: acyl carrier protein [Acidobacteriia bacterium]|nr:acyl carrier protein [Terriglobia bacterium]
MQDLIGKETVSREIKKALVETLRVGGARIGPETSIVKDLAAESLDFLDLNYRLEQAFGIRMARHFFLEHMEEMFGEGSAIDEKGRLTPRALAVLRARYPEATLPEPGAGIDMDEVPSLITVQAMTDTVMDILDTLPDRCSCGASAWRTQDGTHVVCGTCLRPATFTNGDDLTRQWLSGLSAGSNLP